MMLPLAGRGPLLVRARSGLSPVLAAINRMFPGYLSGDVLRCDVPSELAWHRAVGAWQGSIFDPDRPADGETPASGMYHVLDCDAEFPA